YAPSATVFAWLREKQTEAERIANRSGPPKILAVGNPIFSPTTSRPDDSVPPDHGVLVTVVGPKSAASQCGIKAGDVILQYGSAKLKSAADLESASTATGGDANVTLRVWRDGETFARSVKRGPLGVLLSDKTAEQAVRALRKQDQLLHPPDRDEFTRLR